MKHSFRMAPTLLAPLMAALLSAVGSPALAQHEGHEHLGVVHFATSCNETAQQHFDRAMKYQHSFWYRESKNAFEEALKADARCGIAYWGIAQSLLANPFNPTPPRNLAEGLAATRMGAQIGAQTPRERDLISAIGVFYTDYDRVDQHTRTQAYSKAMEQVATRYPDSGSR